ncbi:ribosomal protein L6, bacterial type [SAR116 cluster alpha proteobacterium HIMB100]|nr:ribosomal protein L6, bacterial type [SAR116 cluster alpha proteobacterium HIMB100]
MSRVGNSPIKLPDGVNLTTEGARLVAKGSKGELAMALPSNVDVAVSDGVVTVSPREKTIQGRSIWGTVRANINNMVVGVSTGFTRNLEINGVGYRAAMQGNKLQLSLGYSHPVEMDIPAGLTVKVENNTKIEITGADKQLLGQFASEVRAKRPPEPFKGKGVKYAEEHIVRKEGKKK